MRIDHDYMKELLDKMLEHEQSNFNINIFPDELLNDTPESMEKFVFHMEILDDYRFIQQISKSSGFGFRRTGNPHDPFIVALVDIRMTAQGHDFAAALNKPGVFKTLKTKFKDEGPTETVKLAFKLSGKALDNIASGLVED